MTIVAQQTLVASASQHKAQLSVIPKPRFRWNYCRGIWQSRQNRRYGCLKCEECGRESLRGLNSLRCNECALDRTDELRWRTGSAHSKVARAIKRGDLQPAYEFDCIDCGNPAEVYDHRDYSKPLDVQPVCHRCNVIRGAATDAGSREKAA